MSDCIKALDIDMLQHIFPIHLKKCLFFDFVKFSVKIVDF